jgi:hypothetical protein
MTLHVNNFLSWVAPREVSVNDSGTWRSIREIYVNDNSTWRKVFTRGLTATLTAGTPGGATAGYERLTFTYGNLSENTLHDGRIVVSLNSETSGPSLNLTLQGSSDPGIGYVQELIIAGYGSVLGVNANYGYIAPYASWQWFVSPPFVNGGTYEITLLAGA